eukprot:6089425-Amphidinium_carterae.1
MRCVGPTRTGAACEEPSLSPSQFCISDAKGIPSQGASESLLTLQLCVLSRVFFRSHFGSSRAGRKRKANIDARTGMNMEHLLSLKLQSNLLRAKLPAKVMKPLTALAYLRIGENRFTGRVPYEGLTSLLYVAVDANCFTGMLPDGMKALRGLRSFYGADNVFTGALPPLGLSAMTALRTFFASNNKLTGVVPTEGLRNIPLQVFDVEVNRFQ